MAAVSAMWINFGGTRVAIFRSFPVNAPEPDSLIASCHETASSAPPNQGMSMLLNRQSRGGDGNLADPLRTAGVEEKINPNESNRFRKIVA
jgi:hypothetical protein